MKKSHIFIYSLQGRYLYTLLDADLQLEINKGLNPVEPRTLCTRQMPQKYMCAPTTYMMKVTLVEEISYWLPFNLSLRRPTCHVFTLLLENAPH